MKRQVIKLGTFSAKGDSICVEDQSIGACGCLVSNILKGDWVVEVVKDVSPMGYLRPAELRAHHETHIYPHEDWQLAGEVAVDSAHCAIDDFEVLAGDGDGLYPVEVRHHGGHVVAVRVRFF